MEIIIIILLVTALIIFLIVKAGGNSKKKNGNGGSVYGLNPVNMNYTPPVNPANCAGENTADIPKSENEENHMVTPIFIYDKKSSVNHWICPNCESENNLAYKVCSVCNRKRDYIYY